MVESKNGQKLTKIEGGDLLESLFLETGEHSIFRPYSISIILAYFSAGKSIPQVLQRGQ